MEMFLDFVPNIVTGHCIANFSKEKHFYILTNVDFSRFWPLCDATFVNLYIYIHHLLSAVSFILAAILYIIPFVMFL